MNRVLAIALAGICCFCGGCAPAAAAGGIAGMTAAGGHYPGNEIQQIYYLGVFDPQEQVPPTVYRVRVHGQASSISGTKFASGWVPAQVIDTLGSHIEFAEDSDHVEITQVDDGAASFETGRRLMLFGPEGFREAPADHRLVIVMGSSPDKYFKNINEALGFVTRDENRMSQPLAQELFAALADATAEREHLDELEREIDRTLSSTPAQEPEPVAEPGGDGRGDEPDDDPDAPPEEEQPGADEEAAVEAPEDPDDDPPSSETHTEG